MDKSGLPSSQVQKDHDMDTSLVLSGIMTLGNNLDPMIASHNLLTVVPQGQLFR